MRWSISACFSAVCRVGALPLSRAGLLAALIGMAGGLSAIYSNDIICLAMPRVVARLCLQRRLTPLPFLIGLACSANIGSAATLIGNPQQAGVLLALVSTFAGSLLLVGSIANLIVADLAVKEGIERDWKRHALTAVPVTQASLAVVCVLFSL